MPLFYVSLNVHEHILNNVMLDSRVSHNLMPKVIMERLVLDITKTYMNLYSFDSSKVKCLVLINYLVVSLSQIPSKCIVMDIVVEDMPPKFSILLYRSWMEKLNGEMKKNMSYITFSVFGGETRRLHHEPLMQFMISNKDKLVNHLEYTVQCDFD